MADEIIREVIYYQIEFLYVGKIKTYFSHKLEIIFNKKGDVYSFTNRFPTAKSALKKMNELSSKTYREYEFQVAKIHRIKTKICEV